jgi:hypothetical protein
VGTLAFLLGHYHRSNLLGALAGIVAVALPTLGVIASLRLVAIPIRESSFWAIVPAGILGEMIFIALKRVHFSKRPTKF